MNRVLAWMKQYGSVFALMVAIAGIAPTYWTALLSPAIGIYHDDSIYMNTARALVEGRGYTIESTPVPMPQTKYPILFPALLTLVWKLQPSFPQNTLLFKLVPFLAACVWFWLSYRLILRVTSSRWLAASAVALTIASPQVVFMSTAVLSETLFAAICTGCLLIWTQDDENPSRSHVIWSAILAAAAFHTRTIGFCLIATGIVLYLSKRRFRDAFSFGWISAVLASPWLIWQLLNRAVPDPYLSQENYYSSYNIVFNFDLMEKLRILGTNLLFIPFSVQTFYNLSWGGIIGIAIIPFALRALFTNLQPVHVRAYLLSSLTVIMLWVWSPIRFLVPLVPLFVWLIWSGLPQKLRAAMLVASWLLIIQGISASRQYSEVAVESGYFYPGKISTQDWHSFTDQMRWIEANTPADAIIQSNMDPSVFLFTGRRAIRGSHANVTLSWYLDRQDPLGTASQFQATLLRNHVSYVLSTPWPWFLENIYFAELIRETIKTNPPLLKLEHKSNDPEYRIYSLTPQVLPN